MYSEHTTDYLSMQTTNELRSSRDPIYRVRSGGLQGLPDSQYVSIVANEHQESSEA